MSGQDELIGWGGFCGDVLEAEGGVCGAALVVHADEGGIIRATAQSSNVLSCGDVAG